MSTTTTDTHTFRVTYGVWELSSKGTGTVTYKQFRLPGSDEWLWPEQVPGAEVLQRQRGGTRRAWERQAMSIARIPLPVGCERKTIIVEYDRHRKSGSTIMVDRLVRYETDETGKVLPVLEKVS